MQYNDCESMTKGGIPSPETSGSPDGTFHDMPSHEVPSHEVPSHEVPSHKVPSHDEPSHEVLSHDASSHEVPPHEVPPMDGTRCSSGLTPGGPITEEQILAFEQELVLSEKAPRTREKYLHAVRSFAGFLGDAEPTKERLIAYRDQLQETHRPQTVNGYLTAIHTFLRFLGLDRIRVNQLRVQNCAFIDDARLMTKEEYLRLVDEAWHQDRPRLALLLMTLGITGIRVSELRYFTVESVQIGRIYINLKGKNRTILITRDLRNALLDYAGRNGITTGPIFLSGRGNPLNRSNIAHEMKHLCESAGVDPNKVFPHGFRHLFAREFYAKYPNISSLADLLGHSSIETTRRYIATSASEHERHLESLDLFHLPDAG